MSSSEHKITWRSAALLLAAALVVGYLSAVSDNVYSPYQISPGRWLLYAISGIVNDFTVWLALASFTAWRWGRSVWAAISCSTVFSLCAVAAYLVISPLLRPGHYMVDTWMGYTTWATLTIAGGLAGGTIGFLTRRWRIALFPIVLLAFARVVNEPRAWQSPMGASHHVALLLLAAAIFTLWVVNAARLAQRSKPTTPSFENQLLEDKKS